MNFVVAQVSNNGSSKNNVIIVRNGNVGRVYV